MKNVKRNLRQESGSADDGAGGGVDVDPPVWVVPSVVATVVSVQWEIVQSTVVVCKRDRYPSAHADMKDYDRKRTTRENLSGYLVRRRWRCSRTPPVPRRRWCGRWSWLYSCRSPWNTRQEARSISCKSNYHNNELNEYAKNDLSPWWAGLLRRYIAELTEHCNKGEEQNVMKLRQQKQIIVSYSINTDSHCVLTILIRTEFEKQTPKNVPISYVGSFIE